ncbi:hypothetical protein MP228_002815 [Amoeboaphelidium protococcarum]|nr:hypothetical protein MP228_002815 [Amoeboaphelidium protococcarum]
MTGGSIKDVKSAIEVLLARIRRREVNGAYGCAIEVLYVMRALVSNGRWANVKELLELVKEAGYRLSLVNPAEFTIANTARRVMHVIREEYHDIIIHEQQSEREQNRGGQRQQSFSGATTPLLIGSMPTSPSFSSALSGILQLSDSMMNYIDYTQGDVYALKPAFIQGINDLIEELGSVGQTIAAQALDHIHAKDVIMTIGRSKTVESFLKAARRKREFQVIVAECAPQLSGHEMAQSLAKSGIDTTLVPDCAVHAMMMSRVNMVMIGCHAILADGSIVAPAGTMNVVAVAQSARIPVVVCTGLYKLSPIFKADDVASICADPSNMLSFQDPLMQNVQVVNPLYDYINAGSVNMFITNTQGCSPQYMYRYLSELYHPHDYDLTPSNLNQSYGKSDANDTSDFNQQQIQ